MFNLHHSEVLHKPNAQYNIHVPGNYNIYKSCNYRKEEKKKNNSPLT